MGDEIVRKIQVGEKIIEYNLIRKNVKRINMRVKLDGTVWISANDSEPISKIEAFIIKNADEILKFIEDIKNLKELTNEIYILGEKIPVIIKNTAPTPPDQRLVTSVFFIVPNTFSLDISNVVVTAKSGR